MRWVLSWRTVAWLWTAWAAYWAVSALRVRAAERKEAWAARFSSLVLLTPAYALIFWRRLAVGWLAERFLPDTRALRLVALLLVIAGLSLAVWARRHLGEFWSGRVTLKVDHQLIQSGPYARIRHPIYSGLLLATAGTVLFLGQWRALLGLGLALAGLWQKARREEALLVAQFGHPYEEYLRRTGVFVPRLR
jgi:protein-S-isoprenylcysteine O-methyltransferase Ste14